MQNMRHMPQRRRAAAFGLSLLLAFSSLISAQQRRAQGAGDALANPQTQKASAPAQTRPRLVLLIVVDQFRYDYLERFGDLFAPGGIKRLMREGASWTEANYDHMPTYTAPGHSTLMTG